MQIVMIKVTFPHGVMPRVASQGDALVRDFARLVFGHVQSIFFSLLLIFAGTVAVAVGVLKRQNWARILFTGLMVLGIAWNVASLLLVYYFFPAMSDVMQDEPAALQAQYTILRNISVVFSLATFGAFVGLFGWILKRFTSDDIRCEFS